jgi:glycolate oxidase subunit GlcD
MADATTGDAILVQPGALLVSAPAGTGIEALNARLSDLGLGLPIEPLPADLSLATLIRWNAGGRRRMRHGTIVRYLRAAQVELAGPTGRRCLELGGPTLKRATGYGLNRSLVADGPLAQAHIQAVTLNLRPLPELRRLLRFECAGLSAAHQLVAGLLQIGSALSALPFVLHESGHVTLLAEFEGRPAVVERQARYALELAGAPAASAVVEPQAWIEFEELAAAHMAVGDLGLDLSLPRTGLTCFVEHLQRLQQRYRVTPQIWGDFGATTLHVHLAETGNRATGELGQALAILQDLARRIGGSPVTEFGMRDRNGTAEFARNDDASGGHRPDPQKIPAGNSHGLLKKRPAGIPRDDKLTGVSRHSERSEESRPRMRDDLCVSDGITGSGSSGTRQELLTELTRVVGVPYVLCRPDDLACYLRDASIAQAAGLPLAVALPGSTAEVAETVRLAHAYHVPVVTRGAGSGLAGGSTPSAGALVLGIGRMEGLRIDAEQMRAEVEAGVVTIDLQQAAEAQGLYYPPDPSSLKVSTIGGNIACNAGGPRCLKYGVTGDYVLALTAVLADGSIVRWGDGLSGQSPDAGWLQLLIGSEGTLAVITEATLRLERLPATRRTTMAIFERLEDACVTVEHIMAGGIIPAGLEIMDDSTIAVVDEYLHLGLPHDAGALLLLLADGEPEAVAGDSERLAELARRGGARSVQTARSAAEEAELWQARRAIAPALARLRPNRLGEDISVPLPQIAHCVARIKEVEARYKQPIVVFGHAGDGNLHPNILFDARDPRQVERVWRAAEEVFRIALEVGGTLSGEHGIGTLKRSFMEQALGAEQVALQRRIKAQFDPAGLLNPGKVLP